MLETEMIQLVTTCHSRKQSKLLEIRNFVELRTDRCLQISDWKEQFTEEKDYQTMNTTLITK